MTDCTLVLMKEWTDEVNKYYLLRSMCWLPVS